MVFHSFTSMSYHRHAENVLSKVDMARGQFLLYPCSDGAPQRCQWMPLCSVALSPHVLSLAKIPHHGVYEKIQKILIPPNWHQSCHSSVYMAHSKSSSNLSPSCSFTHSASDHPSTPPPVVPTGPFQGPWPPLLTASTAAPAARSPSTTGVWPLKAARCSGVQPQAPKGSETSTAGSTPWLSTAHPHCSGRNCNLWSEVREFHLFLNCIASWFNGSH